LSSAISRQATDSFIEPNAFSMYRLKSLSEYLAEPSAILRQADSIALLS